MTTEKAAKAVEVTDDVAEEGQRSEEEEKIFETVTVGDLGARLVVGTGPFDGSVARDTRLSFLGWTAKDERKLAEFRRKNKNLTQSQIVVEVLGRFTEQWGKHDFTKMGQEAKQLAINMSPAADVFHAWCQLRVEVLGEEYPVVFDCPFCEGKIDWTMHVESVEVNVPRTEQTSLLREFRLAKGIQYNKERHKIVMVAPLRWKTHRALGEDMLAGFEEIKLSVIEGVVVGLDGVAGEIMLPPTSIDTIHKGDMERLFKFADQDSPGPDLSMYLDCLHCGKKLERPMRWEYDLFFSA